MRAVAFLLVRREGPVAEEAKAAATRITEAFELDPETLDRIAFEDWKRQTVENMDEVIRAAVG